MMKMNYVHCVRRMLVGVVIFCVGMTSVGVQPAQASPPARPAYLILVNILNPKKRIYCKGHEYTFKASFVVASALTPASKWKKPDRKFETVTGQITAKLGQPVPGQWVFGNTRLGKFVNFQFQYTPQDIGPDHLSVTITTGDGSKGEDHLDFKVKSCGPYEVHGTADMGATANALSGDGVWNFVGTYDIDGTIRVNEDGTITGKGSAVMFMDGNAKTGEVACELTTPFQGATSVEIEADSNAWATQNVLKLQVHIKPMPVNISAIGCTSFGYTRKTDAAAVTTAAFDMNFAPLPSEGGMTSLKFQLPGQPGEFMMNLMVTPEE